jgi:arylsulfatase
LPTFANVASASAESPATQVAATLDGRDVTAMLKGQSMEPRMLFHYFGVQLQAVREGPWKLFLPISEPPKLRVPSLWFEHQDGLFERQHRLWPKPTLYDLSADVSEKVDAAAKHPEVVARLQKAAESFDASFQKQISPVQYLPGPKPPAPGQIRTAADSVEEWLRLSR